MNKAQLAEVLSGKVAGVSRAQAERFLDEMTALITQKLIAGEEVVFAGFGAFSSIDGYSALPPNDCSKFPKMPSSPRSRSWPNICAASFFSTKSVFNFFTASAAKL